MALFLETNGLGGYSCTTVCGVRTGPSQGLVVAAKDPPGQRWVLLNGFDVQVATGMEQVALSTHQMATGKLLPDAQNRLVEFDLRPWPWWRYDLGGGSQMEFECLARHRSHQFVFSWQLTVSAAPVTLKVRPLLSCRPIAAPRRANPRLDLQPRMPSSRQFVWSLRASAPDLTLLTDGIYQPDPKWVLGFAFADQSTEDLASPCEFSWRLQPRERAHIVASATAAGFDDPHTQDFVAGLADQIRKAERTRRRLFRNEIDRTADQYVATGRRGATILSGYPGGGEMGSAAMIAVRGIALSPGRLHLAGEVLETWRRRLATGLMPSGIAEDRCVPSWHSPAPALWYITAVYEYLRASNRHGRPIAAPERASLAASVHDILRNFAERRHRHIFMDEDALIAEAVPGKHGAFEGALRKRAHIQALWIAALRIGDHLQSTRSAIYEAARAQFERTFWNSRRGFLYREVLSSADQPLSRVETLNLNQILAVGGLPIVCIREDRASLLVQALEGHFHPGNGARGQKRIPWQFGPFIEAWFRVHHRNPEVKDRILKTFIAPWEAELRSCARGAGLGHPHPEAHEKAALPWFTAVEATELQRILHLPELIDRPDPFDDSLGEPFCP